MAALRGGGGGGGGSSMSRGSNAGASASSMSSAAGGGGSSGGGDETPLQKDIRLKAEAQERLRAKFGAGGLKSQSAGFDGGSGGGGGGGGGGDDDFFNVDSWSARCVCKKWLAVSHDINPLYPCKQR